jgi:hypothetical protein
VERGIIKRDGTAAPISAQRRAQFGTSVIVRSGPSH